MSAVMISPAIMMTIAQLRLSSSAVYVVKPDLSTAWAIPVVERTSVASTVYTRNHTSALLPHCTSLSVTGSVSLMYWVVTIWSAGRSIALLTGEA